MEPLDELLDIVTDLEALVSWERACGARGVPRAPAGAGVALFGEPVELGQAPLGRSAPPRPEPSRPAPRLEPARPETPAVARPSAPSAAPPPAAPPPPRAPTGQAQLGLPGRWAAFASAPAPDAGLQRVRDELGDCRRCGLCEGRKNLVFGVGSPSSSLVIVGEAPGAREDELGEPFVGPAGEMLDRMLENVLKRSRAQVYILNVIKCRPPQNRDPLPEEIAACRPFLEAQIEAIRPRVLLAVGRIAAQTLLGTTQGINALRGKWHTWRNIPLMATFHPAYLLRTPEDKPKTLQDLKAVLQRLEEPGP